MKTLFSYFCLLFITTVNAQDIRGTWIISSVIQDKEAEEYILSPRTDMRWGNFIEFTDLNTFTSYNSWPCGNDCFITSKGRYNLSNNTVSLFLNSLEYNVYCKELKPLKDTDLGVFTITHKDDNIILKKVKK